jgi:hypothetical protein
MRVLMDLTGRGGFTICSVAQNAQIYWLRYINSVDLEASSGASDTV